jgi:hypothetical protein
MRRRVDIQAILRDPTKHRRLIGGAVQFIIACELGRDLTWEQVYRLVDKEKLDDCP